MSAAFTLELIMQEEADTLNAAVVLFLCSTTFSVPLFVKANKYVSGPLTYQPSHHNKWTYHHELRLFGSLVANNKGHPETNVGLAMWPIVVQDGLKPHDHIRKPTFVEEVGYD